MKEFNVFLNFRQYNLYYLRNLFICIFYVFLILYKKAKIKNLKNVPILKNPINRKDNRILK